MTLADQRGSTLIITLLVVVILTITVTEFLYETWVDRSITANFRDGTKGLFALKSGAEAARAVIMDDARTDQSNGLMADSLKEPWAQSSIAIPLEDTFLFATITDEASKLDINRLLTPGGYPDERQIAIFRRLLYLLELDENIADYTVDWIDANEDGPAENSYYSALKHPYRCKNARFDTLDELRKIRGVDAGTYALLRKYVTIAGMPTININTAKKEMIMALHDEISASMADDVVKAREDLTFKMREDIKNLAGFSALFPQIANNIDVRSSSFSLEESVTFNETRRVAHALFTNRTPDGALLVYFRME